MSFINCNKQCCKLVIYDYDTSNDSKFFIKKKKQV